MPINKSSTKIATIAAALGTALLAAAPASAAGVKVGTLTCDVEAGWGYVLGSQKDLNCAFKSATNGRIARWRERFTAVATRRWYFRLLPVIRRGSSLPCSLMN